MENDRQTHRSRDFEKKVRKYYDDNTKMFLKLGEHGAAGAIHQPLYLRGNDSLETAIHVQHEIILQAIREKVEVPGTENSTSVLTVLDLGCGVGSSLRYLAQRTGHAVKFIGVTLSEKQYHHATSALRQHGLESQVRIELASFLDLPDQVNQIDIAFAIEAFIHATDASLFFKEVASVLNTGGRLLIFDDFLADASTRRAESRTLRDFSGYWHAHSLLSVETLAEVAGRSGFSRVRFNDYTHALKLNRPRDKFVRFIAPLAKGLATRSSYCTFLVGGNARQCAYRENLLQYGCADLRYGPTHS